MQGARGSEGARGQGLGLQHLMVGGSKEREGGIRQITSVEQGDRQGLSVLCYIS